MKRIKKIVALALATVMMLAMSITAFAADTNPTATITVNGLADDATVNIYSVATIEKNKIKLADWVGTAYKVGDATSAVNDVVTTTMSADDVDAIKTAFEATTVDVAAPEQTAVSGSVSFTNLPAGIYYIKAASAKASYSPMVTVAIKRDDKGKYIATSPAAITAKGTENDITKVSDDLNVNGLKDVFDFVYAGQELEFEVTKKIPSHVKQFIIYDVTENLTSLDGVDATVTYNGTDHTYTFAEVATDKYMLDLSDIVYDGNYKNDFAGETLTIKYKANVVGIDGYTNTATYSVEKDSSNNDIEKGNAKVEGFQASIKLTKKGSDDKLLENAKFELKKIGSADALTFTKDANGVYVYDETSVVTELVTDASGVLMVAGLDDASYQFVETEAPDGYSINENIDVVDIVATNAAVDEKIEVTDSTLVSLPFTGGIGTTIFTVLGVLIMVIAATLYFITKKKASK